MIFISKNISKWHHTWYAVLVIIPSLQNSVFDACRASSVHTPRFDPWLGHGVCAGGNQWPMPLSLYALLLKKKKMFSSFWCKVVKCLFLVGLHEKVYGVSVTGFQRTHSVLFYFFGNIVSLILLVYNQLTWTTEQERKQLTRRSLCAQTYRGWYGKPAPSFPFLPVSIL